MAFITSPAIFKILDSGGGIVSGNARVLQFTGEVGVVESSPGVVVITVGGAGSQTPNRVLYTGPDGDIKTQNEFAYSQVFHSLSGGFGSSGPPLFFNAFQWGAGATTSRNNSIAIGFNVLCDMLSGCAVGSFNEVISGSVLGDPNDILFVVGIGDNPGFRRDGIRQYKGGRVQTPGARQQAIRTVAVNTTLDAHNDKVVLVDTTSGAINITFPVGFDGLEFTIKNIGTIGGNNVNLIASGGDTLEVATIANAVVQTSYHFIFSGSQWRVLSRYE